MEKKLLVTSLCHQHNKVRTALNLPSDFVVHIQSSTSNVGIGTVLPGAKLQVAGGDAAISTQGNGLILRAFDGPTCYRLTVNHGGMLSTAPVSCPP